MSAGRQTRPPHPGLALVSGVLVCLLLAVPANAARPSSAKADEAFGRIEKAWERGQATRITDEMATRGRVRLQLRDPGGKKGSLSGTYRAGQAETALADYFKKVSSRRLKARKPSSGKSKSKSDSSYRTRYYDYQYRPKGKSQRRATLVVQLRADGSRWVLVSITERGRT